MNEIGGTKKYYTLYKNPTAVGTLLIKVLVVMDTMACGQSPKGVGQPNIVTPTVSYAKILKPTTTQKEEEIF